MQPGRGTARGQPDEWPLAEWNGKSVAGCKLYEFRGHAGGPKLRRGLPALLQLASSRPTCRLASKLPNRRTSGQCSMMSQPSCVHSWGALPLFHFGLSAFPLSTFHIQLWTFVFWLSSKQRETLAKTFSQPSPLSKEHFMQNWSRNSMPNLHPARPNERRPDARLSGGAHCACKLASLGPDFVAILIENQT